MREITMEKIENIKPYENNPRVNVQAIDVVKKSISEFGFTNPILIDQNNIIIAGHTRYQASKEMGLSEVPVIKIEDMTDSQVKAYRIMDNKSGDYAEWDYQKLLDEIDTIEDYDITLTGFDLLDVEKLKLEFELEDIPEVQFDLEGNAIPEEVEEESNNHIIQYNIVFNDEDEQDVWFSHLKELKGRYPELDTISERIIADIRGEKGGEGTDQF